MKREKNTKSVSRFVLEHLEEVGVSAFNAFFPKSYWYTRLSRNFWGVDRPPARVRQTISSTLNKLKKQGLISRERKHKSFFWKITKDGRTYLKNLSIDFYNIPKEDGVTRLVIFDIPETERKKRDFLRTELVNCNFKILQKSVWSGNNPLPEYFIKKLDELNLKNKVHIFSIREDGTLK